MFRKNDDIGSLEAENDNNLLEYFIQKYEVEMLRNIENKKSIVLGRTGMGKSAILNYLEKNEENVSRIKPESISLRHLSNSNIINYFTSLGVNLELFYKVLWKHVFIVEVIKLYFGNDLTKTRNVFGRIYQTHFMNKKKKKAIDYLTKWENIFWEETEYRVKELETKLEKNFRNSIGSNLEAYNKFIATGKTEYDELQVRTINYEVIHKAQKVVSEVQLEEINQIIEIMEGEILKGNPKKYFIIIDDLDREWVDKSIVYDLIKSLLIVVKNLSKLKRVKIIIALRINILRKILKTNESRGMQREKFNTYFLELDWSKEELRDMVDKRLRYRSISQRREKTLTVVNVFPNESKNNSVGFNYLVDRTLMRPRDVLDFVNKCIKRSDGSHHINKNTLLQAEDEYSHERLQALNDEWLENYGRLHYLYAFLKHCEQKMQVKDYYPIVGEHFLDCYCSGQLKELEDDIYKIINCYVEASDESKLTKYVLGELYDIGLVGFKLSSDTSVSYSHTQYSLIRGDDITDDTFVYVHPMYMRSLRIRTKKRV